MRDTPRDTPCDTPRDASAGGQRDLADEPRGTATPLLEAGSASASRAPASTTTVASLPKADPPSSMEVFQLPTGTYVTRAAFAVHGGSFFDKRHFAATAVLVRHPAGDVLIDAGLGENADEHIESLPSYRRAPHVVGATVSQQLDAVGYDRSRLLGVLITHSHWDHVSGLDSLDVPVITTAEEVDYAERNTADTVFTRLVGGREVITHSFTGPSYLGFSTSWDLHGDGSLVVVPAAGHTSGSLIVFVTLPGGDRYAFIGDLTWQLEGITKRRQRPWLMRRLADTDPALIQRDIDRVATIAEAVHVVPSHDLSAYARIPELTPASFTAPQLPSPGRPHQADAAGRSEEADRAHR